MAKKKFEMPEGALAPEAAAATINALISGNASQTEKRGRGRPPKEDVIKDDNNSKQKGLTQEFTRNTFIISVDTLTRLNNYAYTARITTKEALEVVLNIGLDKEEKRLAKEGTEILTKPKK